MTLSDIPAGIGGMLTLSADKAREVFKKAIVRVRIVQDEPGPVSSRLYLRSLQVRNELIT